MHLYFVFYGNMVRWIWWDWSLVLRTLSSFSALTQLVGSFDCKKIVSNMIYNVFGGMLNLTQHCIRLHQFMICRLIYYIRFYFIFEFFSLCYIHFSAYFVSFLHILTKYVCVFVWYFDRRWRCRLFVTTWYVTIIYIFTYLSFVMGDLSLQYLIPLFSLMSLVMSN